MSRDEDKLKTLYESNERVNKATKELDQALRENQKLIEMLFVGWTECRGV